jgi:hypothetical protein
MPRCAARLRFASVETGVCPYFAERKRLVVCRMSKTKKSGIFLRKIGDFTPLIVVANCVIV